MACPIANGQHPNDFVMEIATLYDQETDRICSLALQILPTVSFRCGTKEILSGKHIR